MPFFSPNADDYIDAAKLYYACAEKVIGRISILDADGDVVLALTKWKTVGSTRLTSTWRGRIRVDGELVYAPEGRYAYQLELRDAAGNTGVTTVPVTLDTTVGFYTVTPRFFSPNGDAVRDTTALGFTLTRPASVEVLLLRDGELVRTLALGSLAAGARSATWDGLDDAGAAAPSGDYRARVMVESALGDSRVAGEVTLDLTKPTIAAPTGVSVTLGSTARMRYTIGDSWSPLAKVTVKIRRASDGVLVKTLYPGWVTTNEAHVASWKPPSRRTYIATFYAIDQARNRQAAVARCTIKVL